MCDGSITDGSLSCSELLFLELLSRQVFVEFGDRSGGNMEVPSPEAARLQRGARHGMRSVPRGAHADGLYRLVTNQQIGRCGPLPRHQHQTNNYRRECRELLIPSMVAENIIGQQPDPPGCLFCMRFSEDGAYLATTNTDTVNIWDPSSGALLHSLKEHKEIVTSIAWFTTPSHTGIPPFFTCSLDKTIRLWMNFKPVSVYTDHKGSLLQFNHKTADTKITDWIRCISLTNSNDALISGCVSSTIYGWDVPTSKALFCIQSAHDSPVIFRPRITYD